MVERARGFPIRAGFFELDVFADELDDVDPVFDELGICHRGRCYKRLIKITLDGRTLA